MVVSMLGVKLYFDLFYITLNTVEAVLFFFLIWVWHVGSYSSVPALKEWRFLFFFLIDSFFIEG